MASLLHGSEASDAMELIALVMIVLFSAGLGLAAARATLWAVFFLMMRPAVPGSQAAGATPDARG
jgi:hypothetical protein